MWWVVGLAAGMNPSECRAIQAAATCEDMNGFSFCFDDHVAVVLDAALESFTSDTYPAGQTGRERMLFITAEARRMLANISTADSAYELTMQSVPFVCVRQTTAEATGCAEYCDEFFAYSGDCADGCVYSFQCESLLTELDAAWLLHEYGHAYHLALGDVQAITDAYTAGKADVWPQLEAKYSSVAIWLKPGRLVCVQRERAGVFRLLDVGLRDACPGGGAGEPLPSQSGDAGARRPGRTGGAHRHLGAAGG